MAKAVFFNIPAHGHMNPALPVMAELVKRGEQIICANTEEFRQAVASSGAQFSPYPDMTEFETLMSNASQGDLARNAMRLVQIGEKMMPWVLDLVAREKPDYLIFDSLAGWGEMAARLKQLPSVASIVTFALNPKAPPPMPLPMIARMAFSFLKVIPESIRTTRRIRRTYGQSYNGIFNALMNTGQLNIVYTSAEFQPGATSFNSSYKFVGTSIQPRPHDTAFPFDSLTGKPLVYISLGTINNQNMAFYKECFAAFADHPGQFILSVGKQTDIASLGSVPANFVVRNFVPQLEILERVDAFVTHGGLNSVHEGLIYGVPMVVIPQQLEQELVARQTEKAGAGIVTGNQSAPPGQVTAGELRQAVERLLTHQPAHQAKARQLGKTLRDAGGYVRAADEILGFVKRSTG